MFKARSVVLIVVAAFGTIVSLPEVPSAQSVRNADVLTVDQAVLLALERNPELLRQRAIVEQARHGSIFDRLLEDPSLSFAIEGIEDGKGGFGERRYGLSQRVIEPANWAIHSRIQRTNVEIEDARYQALERETITRVKKQFLNVVVHTEFVHLGRFELELTEQLYGLTNAMYEVGETGKIDVLRTSVLLSESRNSLRMLEEGELAERYHLLALIASDLDGTHYAMVFPDTLLAPMIDLDQTDLKNKLADHPMYRVARLTTQNSSLATSAVSRSLLPSFEVGAYRQDFGEGYRFNSVEFGVQIPIWSGLARSNRLTASRAAEKRDRHDLDAVMIQIERDAEIVWHRYSSSKQVLNDYNTQISRDSRELLELATVAWKAGESGILEVLEAQRTLIRTERQYYEALLTYMQSLADMEAMLGQDLITHKHFER